MNENIKVVFFDLFFTLITPKYNDFKNENDVLGMTQKQWEIYAEDEELYMSRALGKERNPETIIKDILKKAKVHSNKEQINEILYLRQQRMKKALVEVDKEILNVLLEIKNRNKKLCIISNADVIDIMHWKDSPLNNFFDDTIFSCEVGFLKPNDRIYDIALRTMGIKPNEGIFIGDGGSSELEGAKSRGLSTIMTTYLLKRDEKDKQVIGKFADYIVDDFKEILNVGCI